MLYTTLFKPLVESLRVPSITSSSLSRDQHHNTWLWTRSHDCTKCTVIWSETKLILGTNLIYGMRILKKVMNGKDLIGVEIIKISNPEKKWPIQYWYRNNNIKITLILYFFIIQFQSLFHLTVWYRMHFWIPLTSRQVYIMWEYLWNKNIKNII